jgi:CTP synthase
MNPYRHGEVFVLDDKSEVDMDFGTYERFLNRELTGKSSITGGKLFSEIIKREREGAYLGEDVQVIPHLTNLITDGLKKLGKDEGLDFLIIEVGGTAGDLENGYFLEAMRELSQKEKVIFIDVTLIPELKAVGEQKTKPTQIALRQLMQIGIKPDFLVCRGDNRLESTTKKKLALYANLPEDNIIDDSDSDCVYSLPESFMSQNMDRLLLKALGVSKRKMNGPKLKTWKTSVRALTSTKAKGVKIAIVGKYVKLKDAYVSVKEALQHSAAAVGLNPSIMWLEAEDIDSHVDELREADGIIVPGGFGKRGIEGMIKAIKFARENGKPYLGLCLGMQLMAVEFARNVCGLKDANSTEFDDATKNNVVDILPSQRKLNSKGGTMRLGTCEIQIIGRDTIVFASYKSPRIHERHRHRYEINPELRPVLEKAGLRVSAVSGDEQLVECIEWPGGFGIGSQFHPEFTSRPEKPAPLFTSFTRACAKNAG